MNLVPTNRFLIPCPPVTKNNANSACAGQDAGGHRQSHPSASCVAAQASSSTRPPALLKRNRATDAGRIYVEAVLDRYLWLPGTPTRTSRSDRRLAGSFYERGVQLAVVQAALLLGVARRAFRSEDAPPLPPIRTLHYFVPLVEELLEEPAAPGYSEYLEHKLLSLADAKAQRRARPRGGRDRDPSS